MCHSRHIRMSATKAYQRYGHNQLMRPHTPLIKKRSFVLELYNLFPRTIIGGVCPSTNTQGMRARTQGTHNMLRFDSESESP